MPESVIFAILGLVASLGVVWAASRASRETPRSWLRRGSRWGRSSPRTPRPSSRACRIRAVRARSPEKGRNLLSVARVRGRHLPGGRPVHRSSSGKNSDTHRQTILPPQGRGVELPQCFLRREVALLRRDRRRGRRTGHRLPGGPGLLQDVRAPGRRSRGHATPVRWCRAELPSDVLRRHEGRAGGGRRRSGAPPQRAGQAGGARATSSSRPPRRSGCSVRRCDRPVGRLPFGLREAHSNPDDGAAAPNAMAIRSRQRLG